MARGVSETCVKNQFRGVAVSVDNLYACICRNQVGVAPRLYNLVDFRLGPYFDLSRRQVGAIAVGLTFLRE